METILEHDTEAIRYLLEHESLDPLTRMKLWISYMLNGLDDPSVEASTVYEAYDL